jgi:hypothetical protein
MNHQEIVETDTEKNRKFIDIPGLWLKVGQMNEPFFLKELPNTSITNTFISILLLSFITFIISILGVLIGDAIAHFNATTITTSNDISSISSRTRILIIFCGGIITPISFYLNNGITYIGARILGGKGNFSSQAYLHSLFYVPLAVAGGLIGLLSTIPTIGNCIVILMGLVIALFDFYLRIKVLKIVHDFTTGRAIGAILSPIIILLLLPICLLVLLTIMSSAIDNSITNMINAI